MNHDKNRERSALMANRAIAMRLARQLSKAVPDSSGICHLSIIPEDYPAHETRPAIERFEAFLQMMRTAQIVRDPATRIETNGNLKGTLHITYDDADRLIEQVKNREPALQRLN